MTHLKNRFIDHLLNRHAGLNENPRSFYEEKVSDQLLSPFEIRLPKLTLNKMHRVVEAFHELREAAVREQSAQGIFNPGNRSIMMSFDFHLDSNGDPKLIEINTNASFLILSWEMHLMRSLPFAGDFSPDQFRADILEELALWKKAGGKPGPADPRVAIVDEAPADQRLFIEFLVGREWIRSFGWPAEIRDLPDALQEPRPDFIYNRSTDFLLEQSPSAALHDAYQSRSVCVSPNPHEYSLLADKQRLIEWSRPDALSNFDISSSAKSTISACLPRSYDLTELSAEELWARRKNLFFKPKREFGSKRAFRGSSISRRVFDEILAHDPLAQEFVPAPELTFETPVGPQAFKYDLRCHSYADRLEGVVARLYQGQVTNLKTPYGGFAPVVFE